MTPDGVRSGLADALKTIDGLRVFDYIPDSVSPPAGIIEFVEVRFDDAMNRGLDYYKCYALIVLGRMDERSAQSRLDAYVAGTGTKSVKAAIEADKTLGGACSTLRVTDANPRTVVVSGVEMIAYRFGVDVYG